MNDKRLKRLTASSTGRTPVETVLAYIDRYNEADSEGMWALLSPDFSRFGMAQWSQPMGRDAYLDMSRRWNRGFDETTWELIDIVANGPSVVCELYESGVFARPWPITDDRVVPPNGQRYLGRATVWFTVNDAGLIHTYRYYSDDGFARAYGREIAASGGDALEAPAALS